ncbi:MAG: biotin/lipoyl-binding carrier protein [Pseudomonadales bacterium]|jgi:biotin carboxyl carrier protein
MQHEVESEVQGTVWKVEVAEGASVATGDVLVILESMKMEIPVEAPVGGRVMALAVGVEDPVTEGQVIAVIDDGG